MLVPCRRGWRQFITLLVPASRCWQTRWGSRDKTLLMNVNNRKLETLHGYTTLRGGKVYLLSCSVHGRFLYHHKEINDLIYRIQLGPRTKLLLFMGTDYGCIVVRMFLRGTRKWSQGRTLKCNSCPNQEVSTSQEQEVSADVHTLIEGISSLPIQVPVSESGNISKDSARQSKRSWKSQE